MEFCEKLRLLRKNAGMTQEDLAKKLQISKRTIVYYEQGIRIPRFPEIYQVLGEIFGVTPEYLQDNTQDTSAANPDNGMEEAAQIISQVKALFAGGKLSEQDRDAVMRELQEVYWEIKAEQHTHQ